MSQEIRKERLRCILAAEVSFAKGAFKESCILREVSDTGAKMVVPKTMALPSTFELKIPKRPHVKGGVIRWRNGDEIGIEFLSSEADALELTADQSPEQQRDLVLAENARLNKTVMELNQTVEALRKRLDLIIAQQSMNF
jgi:septum formation topological specificity factor MinE